MNLQLFQQILELNRSFDQVAAALQRLQTVPFFQRDLIRHALSDVEIARVYANRKRLPPRVVILPDWDMSDEDRFDDGQARRRARVGAKKQRARPQRKGAHR
jgi:hypothetical protein